MPDSARPMNISQEEIRYLFDTHLNIRIPINISREITQIFLSFSGYWRGRPTPSSPQPFEAGSGRQL